jgi:hypothetical protein
MATQQNYFKDDQGNTHVVRPRFPNEVSINDTSRGSMPNNEKDASHFSLASLKSIIASLKSIYKKIDESSLEKMLSK